MNLFFCAWRPAGQNLQRSELFSQLARLPRNVQFDTVMDGPFAALVANADHALRPLSARYRNLIGVGDVRLDNRAEVLRWTRDVGTGSDLELVLAAIDAHGTEVIGRLLGDFAFVVWDARAQKLIAARDAFGVKPLFMRRSAGLVLAASRASVLAEAGAYDRNYLAHFLVAGEQQQRTIWTGVEAVEPGTVQQQRGTVPSSRRFWDAASFTPAAGGDEQQQVREFRNLFRESIELRLDAGAPTWAQLSGGVDSSSIVSMAENGREGATPRLGGTVTLVDSLGDGDETAFSDLVVEKYGLRNEKIADVWPWRDDGKGPPETDEPHPLYPFYARDRQLCETMRSQGARVMLSGFGADHYLFGNLAYIPDLVMAGKLMHAMRELTQWSIASRQSVWRAARFHVVRPLLRRQASASSDEGPQFPVWLGDPRKYASLQSLTQEAPAPRGRMFATCTARGLASAHAWIDRGPFQEGMEMRYPFLHRPLVEYSLRLPVHMRIRPFGRKWVLREAMQGVLPEAIRTRTGKGGIDARILWALQKEKPRVDALLRQPLLADLGLLDGSALRKAVDEARRGVNHNLVLLMSALSLETWLSVREGRVASWRQAA